MDPVSMALENAHPADRERLQAYVENIFEGDQTEPEYSVEYRLLDSNGETKWVRIDTHPVVGPDGDVEKLVGMLEDITEQKQRERRFNAIFNQTFQLTGLVEPDGTVLEVNDRAVEYLDLDREAIIGTPVSRAAEGVLSPSATERLQDRIEEAAEGAFVRYEESVSTAEGAATLDISIKPITDNLGSVVLLVLEARDVTERKRRERELARQNERLEEFASIVSHDLRNPLQIIRARIGLTRDTGDQSHLEDAERAVDRMDRLIDDLLNLARHGDLSVDIQPTSLEEAATHAWVSVDAPQATMNVESTAAIRADPDRLLQLFENLFRNAVEHGSTESQTQSDDATEHGGADVSVRVGLTDDGFYVEDDGPGVPESERETIFDLGHTTESSGTGFGLAIVKEIVDSHGWSVDIVTAADGGARFEVSGVERLG
jgi:PAS domain S-box-containing protein